MFEYTNAFMKPFAWARTAYERTLGLSSEETVKVTEADLVRPTEAELPEKTVAIRTDSDWNGETRAQVAAIGALYQCADMAEGYLSSLRTQLGSRVSESERRVQELENSLRTLRGSRRIDASTSITIRGGDASWLEADEKYYRDLEMLERVSEEGVFRLPDTGAVSSIRSLGGFGGRVAIERSLGQIQERGALETIADGSRDTFWMGTVYAPAPVRADQADVPWLPAKYRHGSAIQVTYFMDRKTLASEVFVDPVTTEPFDLVAISWTPGYIVNTIPATGASFDTLAPYWATTGSTSRQASGGIANGACLLVAAPSGKASFTFSVAEALAPIVSGSPVVTDDDIGIGSRVQLTYSVRGRGDVVAGARLVWLAADGKVIHTQNQEGFPPGFFVNRMLVDAVPSGAASGRVELGVFTAATAPASAWFDDVDLRIGEKQWNCAIRIDKPTTVTLREIATSDRFSFVFAQRSPRRETLSVAAPPESFTPLAGIRDIDPSLQTTTQRLADEIASTGPGSSVFAYRIGIKELDLRYREHKPHGSIVSLPVKSSGREIRRVWVTAELGKHHNGGVDFVVYPFESDVDTKAEIAPFVSGDPDSAEGSTQIGKMLHIHTVDEADAGWINPSDSVYVVKPRPMKEVFVGTDRNGKVTLAYAPHLRLPKIHYPVAEANSNAGGPLSLWGINAWLEKYSIFPTQFDPNAEILYGAAESASDVVLALREKRPNPPGLSLLQLKTAPGYIPIRVTVRTDRWTAHPDTFGRPDRSKVREILSERLEETQIMETVVEESQEVLSFDAWLNAITSQQLKDLSTDSLSSQIGRFLDSRSNPQAKAFYDSANDQSRQRVKDLYNRLRADGRIPKDTGSTVTRTAAVERSDTYKTRYAPIITGPTGASLKVFAHDTTSGNFLPLPSSAYHVDPAQGVVKMLTTLPSSYTEVWASYRYVAQDNVEDFSSSVVGHLTEGADQATMAANVGLRTRSLPITRNMTDYVTGRVPTLRAPDFDQLSRTYYPVIEYYVTPQGEIVFGRDFFQYGDIPATVEVEYETLAIRPRVGVEVTRGGSPSATPQLSSVTLHVREGSSSPDREVS